ncbi:PP2C-domain-containing protein [Rhizopogon vinicolor AM-OR11-026]|uniref:protein-serine/threonine phosphatase n=1 Tax=Rhizopogon vinicolor AM-OR11-026 TaxID=1314800 RepID=A0A1B7N1M8_9AGAM|nr:PP2C-domain-containing protein [Rhizopogon vinicolor AM-OR11-026]
MGQTLSAPATTKKSESGEDDRYLFAVSEMQGWRVTMEDAHVTVLSLEESTDKNTFFAVYDGHGGSTVARFAGEHVHKRLVSEETYHEKRYAEALKKAFLGTDEDLLADPSHTRDPSGCTAVAALLTDENKIYVANAGDSRSVLSIKGEVKPLSFDHKPVCETERARITEAGGFVEYGRVNGNLALSRALGDFDFKKNYALGPQKQIITADPDVTVHDISDEDEFLILACDGIWDCLSSQQVVDFVRLKVSEGMDLKEIGELMCEHCLAPDTSSGTGIGCDNMTVLIVALLHGRTKEEWYGWIKDRVKNGYGYATPDVIPQIYSQDRLTSYKARKEALQERERLRKERGEDSSLGNLFGGNSAFSGFARVLGSTGGISFHPGSGILGDSGRLMFANDDEDDDSDEDMDINGRSFFSDTFGPTRGQPPRTGPSLQERLASFEDEDVEDFMPSAAHIEEMRDEEVTSPFDSVKNDIPKSPSPTPSPTNSRMNGDVTPVQQFKSPPLGDALNPAVKVDGLMDSSEDPWKA